MGALSRFCQIGGRAGGVNTTVKEKYITIYPKGDFNHNWEVEVRDVALVAYMVVNRAPAQVPDADFNANGFVDIGDAGKIVYFVVKKIPDL
jgi:PKD repeat protein